MELLLYPILSQEARHVEQVSYGENKLLQGFLLQGLRQARFFFTPTPPRTPAPSNLVLFMLSQVIGNLYLMLEEGAQIIIRTAIVLGKGIRHWSN